MNNHEDVISRLGSFDLAVSGAEEAEIGPDNRPILPRQSRGDQ